ncbi:Transcription factor IIIB 50 kDa subunit [Mactra antiquata]
MDCCSVCGENSVRDDYENGRKIRVCFECGTLANDTEDLTSDAQFEGTTITTGKSFGPHGGKAWQSMRPQINKGKENGKKVIRNIGQQLNFTENMIDEASELFEGVYDDELYRAFDDHKKAWCLACVYVSVRKHGYCVSIRDLGSLINIDNCINKLGTALKCLKINHNVHLPPVNVTNGIQAVFSKVELPGDVLRMTQQLMMLLQRVLVTQGRPIESCAIPCAYFAWKASDFFKNKSVSLAEFCKRFNVNDKHKLGKKCLNDIFKMLAMEIPWIKASGQNVKHVEPHLKDIIRYQSVLISEAVQTSLQDIDMSTSDKDLETEITSHEAKLVKLFRRPPEKRKYDNNTDDGNDNKIKEKVAKKRSNRTVNDNDDSNIENYDFGSDDDTDCYILSKAEVDERKQLKKLLESSNDNINGV